MGYFLIENLKIYYNLRFIGSIYESWKYVLKTHPVKFNMVILCSKKDIHLL